MQKFLKDHSGSNGLLNGLKTTGELASWVTSLVSASLNIADVFAKAAGRLAVVSPVAGLASWIFGLVGSIHDSNEHKRLVEDIHNNFRLLNNMMNSQYEELKDYVDDSIIAVDRQYLIGELKQMQLHLLQCFHIWDPRSRDACVNDRCSLSRGRFPEVCTVC